MVTLIEQETTYNLEMPTGASYTVTRMADYTSLTIHYDVFNDNGDIVKDEDEHLAIITYLESNI